MQQETESNKVWQATMDQSGRILLPVELRRAMDVDSDTQLLWVKDESGLHLKSFEDSLAEVQAYYLELAPADVVWSDELIKQRRVEAGHE